jgi:hypothetical protein
MQCCESGLSRVAAAERHDIARILVVRRADIRHRNGDGGVLEGVLDAFVDRRRDLAAGVEQNRDELAAAPAATVPRSPICALAVSAKICNGRKYFDSGG